MNVKKLKSFFSKVKADSVPVFVQENEKNPNVSPPKNKNSKHRSKEKQNKEAEYQEGSTGQSLHFTNCDNIHIGNVNNLYKLSQNNILVGGVSSSINKNATKNSPPTIPNIVKENFNNIEMVKKSDFNLIKKNILNWAKLNESLCPYIHDVSIIDNDEEKIIKILEEWCEANGRYATIGILCAQLWEMGETKAAENLALKYNNF